MSPLRWKIVCSNLETKEFTIAPTKRQELCQLTAEVQFTAKKSQRTSSSRGTFILA